MRSPHVTARLDEHARPSSVDSERVTVPASIVDWKADPEERLLAASLQKSNRIALQRAFSSGFAAVDYERDPQGNGAFILQPWPFHQKLRDASL